MGTQVRSPQAMPDPHVLGDLPAEITRHHRMVRLLLETRVAADDFTLAQLAARIRHLAGNLMLDGREVTESEFGDLLVLQAAAGVAALELAAAPAGAQQMLVVLPTRDAVERPSTGPRAGVSPLLWLDSAFLALARSREDLLADLVHVAPATFAQATEHQAPTAALGEALLAVVLARDDAGDLIGSARDAVARHLTREELNDADLEVMEHLVGPELDLLEMIHHSSAEGATLALRSLMEHHITYWEKDTRRNDPRAWYCLPGLGLAALARAQGLAVTGDREAGPADPDYGGFLPLGLIAD